MRTAYYFKICRNYTYFLLFLRWKYLQCLNLQFQYQPKCCPQEFHSIGQLNWSLTAKKYWHFSKNYDSYGQQNQVALQHEVYSVLNYIGTEIRRGNEWNKSVRLKIGTSALNGLEGVPEKARNFAIGGATRVMTAEHLSRRITHISTRFKTVGDNTLVVSKRNKILSRTTQIADLPEWFLWQSTPFSNKLFLDVTFITVWRMGVSSLFLNQPDWWNQTRELRMDVERIWNAIVYLRLDNLPWTTAALRCRVIATQHNYPLSAKFWFIGF